MGFSKNEKSVEGAQTGVKSYSDVVLFCKFKAVSVFCSFNQKGVSSFIPLGLCLFFFAGLIAELSDSNTMAVWKSTKVMVQLPVLQLSVFEYAFPNGLYIVCVDGSGINTWLALIRCIET